ncbi:MAG: isopentenyl-diphosphate Delta-isomerase [Jannaschia helgolandensis]
MTPTTLTPDAGAQTMIPAWVNGKLTPVEKLAAHRQGLRHKAVSVFVVANGHLLIQRRAAGKYHTPGLWANTCCTHPQWNEASAACASRRLTEELGITGLTLSPRPAIEYRADVGGGMIEHEVAEIFVARTDQALTIQPNPEEVQATRWAELSSLTSEIEARPDIFTPWLRIYLRDNHARIFGNADNVATAR